MTNATVCAQFPSNTFIQDVLFKKWMGLFIKPCVIWLFIRSITGTGSEKVVASLSCSPDGRCTDVVLEDIGLSWASCTVFANPTLIEYGSTRSTVGTTSYTCQNVNITGDAVSLFPQCTVTWACHDRTKCICIFAHIARLQNIEFKMLFYLSRIQTSWTGYPMAS